MTLFSKINSLIFKALQARILFASMSVITLILILALTVNSAREKEMVGLFSRQQLAHVQNTATRMADVFAQVEKNIVLFSSFDPQVVSSKEGESYYKLLASGWETTMNTLVLFDEEGRIRSSYPRNIPPATDLLSHFKIIRKEQDQYLGLALPEKSRSADIQRKMDRYLVVGCPLRSQDRKFSGAWIVSFSLSAVINKYEIQTRNEEWGELCLIDENQQIIVHPDSAFIGKNIAALVKVSTGSKIDFSSDKGACYEASVLQNNQQQRSIISYYPVQAGNKKWILCYIAPYSKVISPVRKTFLYSLFVALLLLGVVIVASMVFAYKEGKKIRIKEVGIRLKEREDWQEKLFREKKTIEGIIEGSPIPMFVINKEHRVILWNRACTELTGHSAEEMLGTGNQYKPFYPAARPMIADLIVDSDMEGLGKHYGSKNVKKSEKVVGAYEATDYYANLGGKSRYLYFLAAPIYDEEGKIIAAIETLQDVSHEREMNKSVSEYAETLQNELIENIELQRKIQGLNSYLQTIITSLPDKIYEIDENGIINFMSRSLKRKEESPREFKNMHFLDFVASGYKEFVLSKWEEAKKGIYRPYEVEATGRDGRKHNFLITTTPVVGSNHYIIVQRDITEFKNLEKQLYDSQKLAALGQLSAGIAHEIRNPLSSIKMSLQILAKRMNPEGNDLKRFKIAEKEVDHLEVLVNDILAFAKPVEPKKAPTDLAKVMEQAIALTEKGITDKKIEVQTEFADLPPVSVDAAMMTDAFLNVIRNAVEAVKENGRIVVKIRFFDDTCQSVAVEIRDNGGGIAEEDMPHIFNPFFTRKNYGTGLGLSLVKKIIDIHQGVLDISSKINEGTTVLIALPLIIETTSSSGLNSRIG